MIIDETERLIIKEIEPADYEQAAFFFGKINTENALAAKDTVYDRSFAEEYCRYAYGFYGYGYYGIYLKSGEIIGLAGFREGSCPLEIGFIVDEQYRRKGYAAEAVKSLTEWAYEDFGWVVHEEKTVPAEEITLKHPDKITFVRLMENAVLVYALTDKENYSAVAVLEKNGYTYGKGK